MTQTDVLSTDVLSPRTFCPHGRFVRRMLCPPDVLSPRTFCPTDVLSLWTFCPHRRFVPTDVLSTDVLSPDVLSPDVLSGHLVPRYVPQCRIWFHAMGHSAESGSTLLVNHAEFGSKLWATAQNLVPHHTIGLQGRILSRPTGHSAESGSTP
jgi:hypothetical protein